MNFAHLLVSRAPALRLEPSSAKRLSPLISANPSTDVFGMPRGLGLATASISAAFLPRSEQRSRGASSFSVTFYQPTKRARAPNVRQRSHTGNRATVM